MDLGTTGEKFELTKEERDDIDQLSLDRRATDESLEIAINYHAERLSDIRFKERAWWDKVLTRLGQKYWDSEKVPYGWKFQDVDGHKSVIRACTKDEASANSRPRKLGRSWSVLVGHGRALVR